MSPQSAISVRGQMVRMFIRKWASKKCSDLGVVNFVIGDRSCAEQVAWCSLLSAYEKGRQWRKVVYTVEKLEELGMQLDVVAWSTTISALAKAGQWELAEEKFRQMQQSGCQPNIVTYSSLIKAYGDVALWDKAESVFKSMCQRGIRCPSSPPLKLVLLFLLPKLWLYVMKSELTKRQLVMPTIVSIIFSNLYLC